MQERQAAVVAIQDVAALVADIDEVVREAVKAASVRTGGGKDIDSWQVHSERVAYAATEVLAAKAMVEYAEAVAAAGLDASLFVDEAAIYAGETASSSAPSVRRRRARGSGFARAKIACARSAARWPRSEVPTTRGCPRTTS
jgi:alkylation response protein AidB-like acyl-CoA dehydrogenase